MSIEALELDLGKFERELEMDLDESDERPEEDEYVCVWDLIEVDEPLDQQQHQPEPPKIHRLESSTSVASGTSSSRIPRLSASTNLASSPSPTKPPQGPRRTSIPVPSASGDASKRSSIPQQRH